VSARRFERLDPLPVSNLVDSHALHVHGTGVNEKSFPVTVLVKRPDGSSESVRVGTAVRSGDGFRLSLGELSIEPNADPASAPARRAASHDTGLVFPPYGRSKGAPVAGASVQDLEFYISGCRRTLDDPAKSRWHEKERVLLAALEAELARQRGDDQGSRSEPLHDYDDVPAPSDDDIPF
jgi:hypothetical protein